ncbi:hypothetical protein C8F01DRAFT_1302548, partial [Mycena amicta]
AGATCRNFQIVPNTADITADCSNRNGAVQQSRLTLSNCLGNTNGVLSCSSGGGAGSSCVFSNLDQAGVFVSSHCTTSD